MGPDPGRQAQQQFDQSRRFREMNDQMDAQRRRRARRGSGSGLSDLLKLALLVGVVVFLVQNPELRAEAWTFAQELWADVQNS
ncbi:hypothetical protein OG266_09315 [Streptomyces sp. NBC_00554]|uniref:hypothetical protein n=1 Tax=Streptomyces sp. NBC_00554 TaxID=2903661 RepID=UPI00352D0C49|nr:hypothetical protein OG266_09315 [Streptomyces sp. NBC_00554]